MRDKLYLTTTIPFVNAPPHLGFALELVLADVVARFHRQCGRTVRLQTGTDEHAIKNVRAARQQGISVQDHVARHARRFRDLLDVLHVSADDFVGTSEPRHLVAVQRLWERLAKGDVYPRRYVGRYCVGCEDFLTPAAAPDEVCAEHGRPLETVAERNYFFRLSRYQGAIAAWLAEESLRVVPQTRANEVRRFVRSGLHDFSISREAERSEAWGTSVPGDPGQLVYVWIDALVNYISGPGFGSQPDWREWWNDDVEIVHLIGKNVWKFHAVYWPALLRSAGLRTPDTIVVHGFLTAAGRKIGKSLGNAIDPFQLAATFGADAVRYYLLRAGSPFHDSDVTQQRIRDVYHADLANGLGNLVSRLAALGERAGYHHRLPPGPTPPVPGLSEAVNAYRLDRAIDILWQIVGALNRDVERVAPWTALERGERSLVSDHLDRWLGQLYLFTHWLRPFLPHTADRIAHRLFGRAVRRVAPLFPRIPPTEAPPVAFGVDT